MISQTCELRFFCLFLHSNQKMEQWKRHFTYQLNFIRLLCTGIHKGFTAQSITEIYSLGSKSNIDRIKKALEDREMITLEKDGVFLADSVFELWFKKEMM